MENEGQGSSSPERRSAENVSLAGYPPSSRTDVSLRNDPQAEVLRQSAQQNSQAESNDPKEPIDDFDWIELEKRFHRKMKECEHVEQEIYEEFNNLLEVFNAWAAAISGHENNRAHKRLKTRMSFVQSEESGLENKRQHYVNVVKAFETALALLGGP